MLEDVIEQDAKFSYQDNGLYMSAALTAYDSETEPIEDPLYGELVIKHIGWNATDDGIVYKERDLEYTTCTEGQLGLDYDPASP